jgi:hypothetical protein
MHPQALEKFEAAAGLFLEELGYRRGTGPPRAERLKEAAKIRNLFEERVLSLAKQSRIQPRAVARSGAAYG